MKRRVVGRHHLPAVGPVELEPVVGARVVRRGDLHPGGGPQVAYGEGYLRRGAEAVEQVGTDPVGREDLAGELGELPGLPAGLVAHDHARLPGGRPVVVDEGAQPLGRLADGAGVDAVRPRAERPAYPSGADPEPGGEGVLELVPAFVRRQCLDLGDESSKARLGQPAFQICEGGRTQPVRGCRSFDGPVGCPASHGRRGDSNPRQPVPSPCEWPRPCRCAPTGGPGRPVRSGRRRRSACRSAP